VSAVWNVTLAEPSGPAVRNWLFGIPFGFVIVSVMRPGGNPVNERSHVEPRGPEFEGSTLTFAPEGGGGGGGGGFVRGAAVGSVGGVVGGANVGGSGAVLPGAAEPPRAEAVADGRGPAVDVASGEVAVASQPTSVSARTAMTRKRPFMVSSYEWDRVPARGTFA
jgi:hypothetical protein